MKKPKELFVLSSLFNNKVKRLTLHVQDVGIDNDGVKQNSATIFGTLQMFKEGDKENVKNINFSLPLDYNKELKNHILSIIEQAIKQSTKKVK